MLNTILTENHVHLPNDFFNKLCCVISLVKHNTKQLFIVTQLHFHDTAIYDTTFLSKKMPVAEITK